MANTISEVRLLSVPLTDDYKNTLYFESRTELDNYFNTVDKYKEYSNLSYIRKDNKLRIPTVYDDLIGQYNYVMYRNPSYKNRWFYAFIKDMQYVNDGCTDIIIETDVIQTWLHHYEVLPSFIEREHVNDDTPGLHTVPEQVELGDYICMEKMVDPIVDMNGTGIVVGSTVDLTGANKSNGSPAFNNISGNKYGNVYSGVRYFVYYNESEVNNVLKKIADAGKSDAITTIFMCPPSFLNWNIETGEVLSSKIDPQVWGIQDHVITKPAMLGEYSVTNKKLLTYPYCYALMSNNSGGSAVYKYELFDTTNISFKLYGAITPGGSVRLIPNYYNGVDENNEEGLTLGKFPVCNWNTDVYTNWLTQNSVNVGTQVVSAGISNGTPNWLLSAISVGADLLGVDKVSGSISETYAHSLQPPQSEGNINSGDVTFSSDNLHFTLYKMCIKPEYAAIIDGYFNMYGYKVNVVKRPNVNHRMNYWFTKTIEVNITGSIPMEDLKKIKECYNKGITFWKNPDVFGDYSATNIIM